MKLVGYIRVSSAGQEDNTSLDEQVSRINAYCQALGHELIHIYREVKSGGRADNRPEFQKTVAHLQTEGIDGLIVIKPDRLGRRASDVLSFFDNIIAPQNKALIIVENNIDTSTATGKMMLGVLSVFAEFEKDQINKRTGDGRKARAKTSEYANGGAPKFGSKAENKNLVIDDEEQKVIEIIRRHHKSGKSQRAIAEYLTKNGYKSKQGKAWSGTSVGRVLTRMYPKAN
ncbi:recombinase family protein [Nostoc edaphicum CCNP1411]|uniref:Recombinase family protein n=1 Tax=Nostoc edaphicum CCNP1411 TaxID=1472755 RepID=A0A7D7QIG5_9NOSO|nr:recombinase family protein [Nostoc edaphicum]QMS91362.1 recombinase family protein [Nostoc edaphicum CCNP1411]